MFGLLDGSPIVKGSGEGHGEQEEDRGGAEKGVYVGDIRMLGEGGREMLLPCEFRIWISRKSPPLTDRAEGWRQTWINVQKNKRHCYGGIYEYDGVLPAD